MSDDKTDPTINRSNEPLPRGFTAVRDDLDAREHRRKADIVISKLVDDVAGMKNAHGEMQRKLDENTIVTNATAGTVNEIKEILTTFKILGRFAKWLGGIVAAVAAAWAAVKGLRG